MWPYQFQVIGHSGVLREAAALWSGATAGVLVLDLCRPL